MRNQCYVLFTKIVFTKKMFSLSRCTVTAMLTLIAAVSKCQVLGYSSPSPTHNNISRGEKVNGSGKVKDDGQGRRAFLKGVSVSSFSLGTLMLQVSAPAPADAFENRLDSKYADATPQTGTQPVDLGHTERTSKTQGSYIGLKQCGTSPNCWCSSAPFKDAPARFIPAWSGGSITDVKKVVDTYEVGQNGIDGGGYKIMEYDEKEKYIYVQFQSYKAGYIDDFECWFNPQSQKFDVRSSSRVGMSDLGVNAKRLEYIAARLEKEFGWTFERRKSGSLV